MRRWKATVRQQKAMRTVRIKAQYSVFMGWKLITKRLKTWIYYCTFYQVYYSGYHTDLYRSACDDVSSRLNAYKLSLITNYFVSDFIFVPFITQKQSSLASLSVTFCKTFLLLKLESPTSFLDPSLLARALRNEQCPLKLQLYKINSAHYYQKRLQCWGLWRVSPSRT